MAKEFKRNQRVGELIRRELADIIRREINMHDIGILTIADVEVTSDLAAAKVYFTVFANKMTEQQVAKALNERNVMLRHHLSQQVRNIRTVPKLFFIYDNSTVEGERLSRLIDSVIEPEPASDKKNEAED